MSQHDDGVYLRHMRDHIRTALKLVEGRTRSALELDETLRYALLHLLCITGEAGSRVSESIRREHPEIAWNAAKSIRNRLIHGYDSVDLDVVWDTISFDLPETLLSLDTLLRQEHLD